MLRHVGNTLDGIRCTQTERLAHERQSPHPVFAPPNRSRSLFLFVGVPIHPIPQVTPKGKNPTTYDSLSIRGNNIRCYILPDNLNLDQLLIDDAPKQKPGKVKDAGGRGRGRGMRGGRGGRGGGGRGRGRF